MTVVVWVVENTWPAVVEAARAQARPEEDVLLVHVVPGEVSGVAHGAFTGLLGRGRRLGRDPGAVVDRLAEVSGHALLDAAAQALGTPSRLELRQGRVEREVLAAAEGARLLVVARDTPLDGVPGPPPPQGVPQGPPHPPPGPPHPPDPPHPPAGSVGPPADRRRPHALGPATRYVVDHAPCAVLLVWPG